MQMTKQWALARTMVRTAGRARIIGLMALGALVAGCTMVRVGYAHADELAFRWIDGYVDFNDNQTPKVRAALTDLHRWHRRTQLPDYVAWLGGLGAMAQRNVTPEDVCKLNDEMQTRLKRVSDQAMPAVAAVAVTLTEDQVLHLQKKLERNDAKFRDDYLKAGAASAREASLLARAVSRAETLYDTVDDAQRDVLQQSVKASPFDAQAMLAERSTRQRELLALLRTARAAAATGGGAGAIDAAAAQLSQGLSRWLAEGRQSPRANYRAYQQKLASFNCEWSARLHNVASPAARERARANVKGWEGDARGLIDASSPG